MSYSLANTAWYMGYRLIGFIQLGIAILLLVTLPVWKVNRTITENTSQQKGLIGVLKIKGVPFLLIGFFAYCAAEATAMNWASTYMTEVRNIAADTAAQFAALFYIGMTLGRFLGGFVMNKLGDRKMILLGTFVLFCGIIALLLPINTPVVPITGFIIIGLGCAPIYPCIIHSTPYNFGAENSGKIIGIQMASAYIGSTFMSPLFGFLGSHFNFNILPVFLAVFFLLMITMTETTFRITARK